MCHCYLALVVAFVAFAHLAAMDCVAILISLVGEARRAFRRGQRHYRIITTQAPPRRDGVARVEVPGRVVLFAAL